MNDAINLYKNRKRRSVNEQKLIQGFRITSIVSLFITLLFAVVLFVIQTQSPLTILEKEETGLRSRLSAFNEKIIKLTLAKERVKEINAIITTRPALNKIMSMVVELVPSVVTINSFQLEKNMLTMELSSSSLKAIEQVIQALLEETGEKKLFKKVTLENFLLDSAQKKYSISLQIVLL